MPETLAFQIVTIAIAGIAAQWVAWRLHIPAIIFLLATGFLLGPMTGAIKPDLLLGDLLQPAISAAVPSSFSRAACNCISRNCAKPNAPCAM